MYNHLFDQFKVFICSISAFTSTISDRIPTNHATVKLIQDDFDNDLHELNCNVHPLDGVANKASAVGKQLDQTNDTSGECYGSEGSATNLIKVMSK